MRWTERAPAKLNLALHVRGRRPDGYHDLETLFAFTRFGDRLEMIPASEWGLELAGPMARDTGPLADNLILRAAQGFAAATGIRPRFAFRLDKRIPVAAGLGGGSANAAAALRLLNRATGTGLDATRLEALGATLGADVAACVRSRMCIGLGRGEVLRPVPDVGRLPVLLVNPRVAVPTGPVFAGWDGSDRGKLSDWRRGRNDLQESAVRLQPVIADVLAWLKTLPGATIVRMSGSGATCFALFEQSVPAAVPPADWWVMATKLAGSAV